MNALKGFVSTISATWRGHGRAEPGWLAEQGELRACQELSLQKPERKIAFKPAELGSLWQCRESGACGVRRITRHILSQLGQAWRSLVSMWGSSHPSLSGFPIHPLPCTSRPPPAPGVSGTFPRQPCFILRLDGKVHSSCPFCRWGNCRDMEVCDQETELDSGSQDIVVSE